MERKSIFHTSVDLLNGPILQSLLIFAVPLFISNIFQQLYNTVDTMIVGNYLGDTSLAAIGSCSAIYDLFVGFALGIGNGLAIVTARSYGSGNQELLKKSVACSMIIGIISSLVITAIGIIFLYPLLEILNTPELIINEAYSYIFYITLFVLVMFAYNLCAGLMRAIGNSVMPLIFLIVSSCFNVILDILFITQFHMGVKGAAIATVIAQGISVVLCIIYMFRKTKILIPERKHFHYDKDLYKEMLGQGLSMGFMSSIVSCGSVILQYGINSLDTLIIASHTVARKIYMFFNMPFTSMALAISTYVSQNHGANQSKRIRDGIFIAYIYDVIVALIITVTLIFGAKPLVQFISGSTETVVISNATTYLLVVGPFYAVLGILMQSRNALQGLGKKMLPLVSSVIELIGKIIFVIVFIPQFQYLAVIFCEPVIWVVMTLYLVYCLFKDPVMLAGKNIKKR